MLRFGTIASTAVMREFIGVFFIFRIGKINWDNYTRVGNILDKPQTSLIEMHWWHIVGLGMTHTILKSHIGMTTIFNWHILAVKPLVHWIWRIWDLIPLKNSDFIKVIDPSFGFIEK
jgi:hypothetical protein